MSISNIITQEIIYLPPTQKPSANPTLSPTSATSYPSSSPTSIYENSMLQNAEAFGPLTVSQFYYLISFVIAVFLMLPTAIFFYNKRGEQKQKQLLARIHVMRFEANKRKLSEDVLRRRDEIRLAFQQKYARDIDVFKDCKHKSSIRYDDNDKKLIQLKAPRKFFPDEESTYSYHDDQKILIQPKKPSKFFDEESKPIENINTRKSKLIEEDPNYDKL